MINDEIKEILNRLERIDHKEYSGGFEFADSSTFYEMARCFEERKKMADYITNLQQKVEYYEGFEINKTIDKIRLQNNREYKEVMTQLEDYKSRCEKAVEYINYCDDLSVINDYSFNEKPVIEEKAKKDLLNILNGRSDE